MNTRSVRVLRVDGPAPVAHRRWSQALQAVCELLGQATGEHMGAISVTLFLGESPDEGLAVARLGKGLAAEHGLRATAVLSDHAVTFRFTRSEGWAWRTA